MMTNHPMKGELSNPRLDGWSFTALSSRDERFETWSCSHLLNSGEFLAKRLIADEDQVRQSFEREAYLASHLPSQHVVPLQDSDLNARSPIIVYPDLALTSLSEWSLHQSMQPSRTVLVWLARQSVAALQSLHQLGYVHSRLTPDHLLLDSRCSVRLGGLGCSLPVGSTQNTEPHRSAYSAPELRQVGNGLSDLEVSSASDIYALAQIFCELIGNSFSGTELARQMLAESPEDRPTCGELLPIFLELERSLFGRQIAA